MRFATAVLACSLITATAMATTPAKTPDAATMDRDLLEVNITKLHDLYRTHKYTVRQVTEWYFARIDKYNPTYKPVLELNREAALKRADEEDATIKSGKALNTVLKEQKLFGVPIVIKANTSIEGLITSDGWTGFMVPGKEFIAAKDAPVVAAFRQAGAIILGHTNMPDFAASDTNNSSAGGRTGNAYNVRYSPGGSSGGTATAVAANLAVLGQGTDTSNSIRNPASTDSLVGFLPSRGLVSIDGIAPYDWQLDLTGPLARNVSDAAVALTVMSATGKQPKADFTAYLKPGALKGKRIGVPSFILNSGGTATSGAGQVRSLALRPETREAFMKAIEGLRAAGATVVEDASLMTDDFQKLTRAIDTPPFRAQGLDEYFRDYAPASFKTPDAFEKATDKKLPAFLHGGNTPQLRVDDTASYAQHITTPRQAALDFYNNELRRLNLDALVYPALQMPPNDEIAPQPDGRPSSGPHSNTGWVNRIGVPAVVVPGGFYENGLPFGLELSGKQFKDGELLGYAYAYEQATHHRKAPELKTE